LTEVDLLVVPVVALAVLSSTLIVRKAVGPRAIRDLDLSRIADLGIASRTHHQHFSAQGKN
jgi:hypothetical protein